MFDILSDLFNIARELGIVDATLFALHLKSFSVEETYAMFMTGKIPADGVYARLRLRQVQEFTELHEQVKNGFNGSQGDIPPFVSIFLALEFSNYRRFPFMLPQVDALIERDIEKNIFRRRGKKNIVRRDS